MAPRRTTTRLIGAVLCAYLVVLQTAFGSLAVAGHHPSVGGFEAVALGVICLNSADAPTADPDGDVSGHDQSDRGCCTVGCVSQAAAAAEPQASPFAYEPRPSPLRTALESRAGAPDEAFRKLRRPRGPPAIG